MTAAITVGSRVTWRKGSGFHASNAHGTVTRVTATNAWVRDDRNIDEERVLLRRLSLMSEREIALADWKARQPVSGYVWPYQRDRGVTEIRVDFTGPASKVPALHAQIDALVAWLAEEPKA